MPPPRNFGTPIISPKLLDLEVGRLQWATYRFDPYDRHNLFNECRHFRLSPFFVAVLTVLPRQCQASSSSSIDRGRCQRRPSYDTLHCLLEFVFVTAVPAECSVLQ